MKQVFSVPQAMIAAFIDRESSIRLHRNHENGLSEATGVMGVFRSQAVRVRCRLILSVGLMWACLWGVSGCAIHHWKHRHDEDESGVACTANQPQIQRRFFVVSRDSLGITGHAGEFTNEVVTALNALPNCVAIPLPPDVPIDPIPGIPGPPPGLMHLIESPVPSSAIDEILIVHVTEVIPFRPMRLSATIERRSIHDGMPIASATKTWTSPLDDEPVFPNKFNRFILNHPPPLGVVEHHEMSRISPTTFQRNIARELALELSVSPL